MATPRKGFRRWLRPWGAAATAIVVLAGLGTFLIATRVLAPPSATAVAQLPLPSGVSAPALDVGTLKATPPDSLEQCPKAKLAGVVGGSVVGYLNDDPSQPDLVPAQARKLGLLDFFWSSIGVSAGAIAPVQTDTSSGEPSLSTVLTTAHTAKKCGLRFATITDNSPGLTPAQNMTLMATLLTNPAKQWEFVQQVSDWTAARPLLDGVSLDLEFGLPVNLGDLKLYAQVAGWHDLPSDPQELMRAEVDRIGTGYTNLAWALAAAMHHQHRLMRVDLLPQNSDKINATFIAPSVFLDKQIAQHVDQLVVMAYNFSYSTGNPGPIAPIDQVKTAMTYVHTWGVPWSQEVAGVPLYAFNWQVDAYGNIAKNRHGQVIPAPDLTPTQLAHKRWLPRAAKLIRPGGVYYAYASGGHTHIVWDSAAVVGTALQQIRQAFPKIGMMFWKFGNADTVGWEEAERALG